MTPAGRRPGPTTTSATILAAARELFARSGYQATTMRGVAERAGVNQALVRHFYGTKRQLFMAAIEFPAEPLREIIATLAESSREHLGERMAGVFVRAWRDPSTSPQLQAVFRSAATTDEGSMMARRMAEDVVVPTVARMLRVEPARVAAALAQLLGFAFLSTIVRAEPLVGFDEQAAIALLAPTVQAYLDAPAQSARGDGPAMGRHGSD
jgi:AcrR family transcriptional regulator